MRLSSDVSNFCRRGFHDCYNFLKSNGYLRRKRGQRLLNKRMSFSEEWHEAQLRRINQEKLIAIGKTLKEFDHLYSNELKQSAQFKAAKKNSKDLIAAMANIQYDQDDNVFVLGSI